MASDHRGNELHAGKRTMDEYERVRVNPWYPEVVGMHEMVKNETGRHVTRQEHNELFTHPDDYPMIRTELPDGTVHEFRDLGGKPDKPMYPYPYPPKYRLVRKPKPIAQNPPPKYRIPPKYRKPEAQNPPFYGASLIWTKPTNEDAPKVTTDNGPEDDWSIW